MSSLTDLHLSSDQLSIFAADSGLNTLFSIDLATGNRTLVLDGASGSGIKFTGWLSTTSIIEQLFHF